MKINEKVKKCVAFLQYKMADDSCRYAGTCFFIVRDNQSSNYCYAITAKHVISSIKAMGIDKVFIKVNLIDGGVDLIPTSIDKWISHYDETVDISILPFAFSENVDHLFYPESSFLSDAFIKSNEIDCGDEVFITGLFKHHHGVKRNLPIVRIGNIAMMVTEEKVQTQSYLMEAYLIESRSIGGLSGSPVFVNLGQVRKLEGQVKHAQGEHIHHLLGLIHGHFDSKLGEIDSVSEDSPDNIKVNVGIAIVTPVSKLTELFESDAVKLHEKEIDKQVEILESKKHEN